MECACCGRPIEYRNAWRASTGRFYCSGFCAESEIDEAASAPQRPGYFGAGLKSVLQRALDR